MEPRKPAPRQGCKLSVTTTATNNHEHLAPLTGCGCDATPFYTPATPDGAAGNPSRMARDKPVASTAQPTFLVAANVRLHSASPWHLRGCRLSAYISCECKIRVWLLNQLVAPMWTPPKSGCNAYCRFGPEDKTSLSLKRPIITSNSPGSTMLLLAGPINDRSSRSIVNLRVLLCPGSR